MKTKFVLVCYRLRLDGSSKSSQQRPQRVMDPKLKSLKIHKVLSLVFTHTKLSHMKSDGMLLKQLQMLIFFLTFVALYRR